MSRRRKTRLRRASRPDGIPRHPRAPGEQQTAPGHARTQVLPVTPAVEH